MIEAEGKLMMIPEGCGFRFVLPPDKKVLQWRQQGRARIDSQNNYCEAAFLVGVPANDAQPSTKNGGPIKPLDQPYVRSKGYFEMWWQDPPGIKVNSATAILSWGWQGPLFCATYEGGNFIDWAISSPPGWYKVNQWNVGSTISCSLAGYTGSSHWRNIGFPPCGPENPLYLVYDPVSVSGDENGYLYGYGHTEVWGGECYLLLTPRSEIRRLEN